MQAPYVKLEPSTRFGNEFSFSQSVSSEFVRAQSASSEIILSKAALNEWFVGCPFLEPMDKAFVDAFNSAGSKLKTARFTMLLEQMRGYWRQQYSLLLAKHREEISTFFGYKIAEKAVKNRSNVNDTYLPGETAMLFLALVVIPAFNLVVGYTYDTHLLQESPEWAKLRLAFYNRSLALRSAKSVVEGIPTFNGECGSDP